MPDRPEEIFHFGPEGARKLGAYHAPDRTGRRTVTVLCNPFGHEAVRAHRPYRQLALRLAALGCPVLRFDFLGCGDSEGDETAAAVDRWVGDVADAAAEARARSGVPGLCVVGGRLGAALALAAAQRMGDVRRLVLWDPVTDGEEHLRELEREHARMLATAHVTVRPVPEGADPERLGFPLPARLERELRALALPAQAPRGVERALIVEGTGGPDGDRLAARLEGSGVQVDRRRADGDSPWPWMEDPARAVLPVGALQAIAAWIEAECP